MMLRRTRQRERPPPPPPPPLKNKPKPTAKQQEQPPPLLKNTPKLKTKKKNSNDETKKNRIQEFDSSFPEDIINLLVGRFSLQPNKGTPTVEQGDSLKLGSSSKRKINETPEKDSSKKKPKKAKKTRSYKSLLERDEDHCPSSELPSEDEQHPETVTLNSQERICTSREKPISNKETQTVGQEDSLSGKCYSKRKRVLIPHDKRIETGGKNKSKNLINENATAACENVIERDEILSPSLQPTQEAQEGLVAASVEEEPQTVTINSGERNEQGCSQTSHTTVEQSSGKKRKGRGIASLACLTEENGGVREVVTYDTKDELIGPVAKKFSTYLGVLARRAVPIIHESWHKVPKDLKVTLLNQVEAKYIVHPTKRNKVMSTIGERWKKFKGNLTRFFIRPLKDHHELLSSPPEQYGFIEQEHWDAFVRSRLSEEFELHSKCQAERQAKNKLHHRVGIKGYAGLLEELKKSLGASADEIDTIDLWKKARQDKNGAYLNDAVREKAELIDKLKKQKEDGNLAIEGDRDILTMALSTPNFDSVTGVRSSLSTKTYIHCPIHNSKGQFGELQEKATQQADKCLEMNQMVGELQAQQKRRQSVTHSVGSISQVECGHLNDDHPLPTGLEIGFQSSETLKTMSDMPSPDFNSTTVKGKCCRLALHTKINSVARGMVYEGAKPNEKIHNTPLGESNVRVTVEDAISPSALLHVPVIGEMTMVKDAIGSFVARPKELVLTGVEQEENQDTAEESGPIQAFVSFLDQMGLTNNIVIPMQSTIFEAEAEASLEKADLMYLCNMQEIAVSCIITYIRFLYEKSKRSRKSYGFVNPASFSSARGPDASSMITKRLQIARRDQLVFVPYKTKGHWALIIINSTSMDVYWVDPMQKPPPMDIKIYVTTGLRTLQVTEKSRPNPTWHSVKCPKPPLDVQSGYYVMRYMRELMEEWSRPLAEKILQLTQKCMYSREEIDEVRLELVDFILTTM